MNWVQALISTYSAYMNAPPDENIIGVFPETSSEDKSAGKKRPLLPLFHHSVNMKYEVEITAEGRFSSARVLNKWEQIGIAPGDNDAGSRTNTPYRKPFGLSDKISVILVDDSDYPENKGFLNTYFARLDKLIHSEMFQSAPLDETEGITAVYSYLKNGSLYDDLMVALPDVFKERLTAKDWKADKKSDVGKKVANVDGFIKFSVIGLMHSATADLTKNKSVMNFFQRYYAKELADNIPCGLSYVTLEQGPLLTKGGRNIFRNANNAKLFKGTEGDYPSSGYFTYNGGFFGDVSECFQMGTIEEQSSMAMLRWLLDNQSWTPNYNSPYTIVAWDMEHAQDGEMKALDVRTLIAGNTECVIENSDDDDDDDSGSHAPSGDAAMLRLRAYKGYSIKGISENTKHVAVAIFAAPSTGRASVLHYADMPADKLMDAVVHWHETAGWSVVTKDGHRKLTAASINTILKICFGRIDTKKSNPTEKKIVWIVDNDRLPAIAGMLFRCLIQNYPLPYEVVKLALDKVIHTERWGSYISSPDYDYFMHYAAGLARKYYIDKEGKDYMPYLNEPCMDRDYLYGRLLAVYDNIERWALSESKTDRPTNATRMKAEFFNKPASTAVKLQMRVTPYIQQLGKKAKNSEDLLNELMAKISSVDGNKSDREMNASIGPRGNMGYAAQMDYFKEKMSN